jgi:SAM-dependent methyltransferase
MISPENMIVSECLLCGGKADLIHDRYPGYQEPETFEIFHCRDCNTAFSLPSTDSSSIYNNIYRNAERVPGYNRYVLYSSFIGRVKNPFEFLAGISEPYRGVMDALSEIKSVDIKVLEIGSGMGYLTYSLVKAGYNAAGIDISETAVENARKKFGNYYTCMEASQLAAENKGVYDVVIATEVIEHIHEPLEFLDTVLALLKPGGKAIITTPNRSLYPSETIWATDLPPVHVWWFSEDSLRYLAEKTGATINFINYSKFYNDNYKVVSSGNRIPRPFFNREGDLIYGARIKKNSLKIRLQAADSRLMRSVSRFIIRNIKKLAGKFRQFTNKHAIVCSDRGLILCAVMEKQKGLLAQPL